MMMRSRFEERLARYQRRLFGYAGAKTGDHDGAHDLLHDCVARAISARDRPREEAAFRAWLFTIMRNLWIDQLRASCR